MSDILLLQSLTLWPQRAPEPKNGPPILSVSRSVHFSSKPKFLTLRSILCTHRRLGPTFQSLLPDSWYIRALNGILIFHILNTYSTHLSGRDFRVETMSGQSYVEQFFIVPLLSIPSILVLYPNVNSSLWSRTLPLLIKFKY